MEINTDWFERRIRITDKNGVTKTGIGVVAEPPVNDALPDFSKIRLRYVGGSTVYGPEDIEKVEILEFAQYEDMERVISPLGRLPER